MARPKNEDRGLLSLKLVQRRGSAVCRAFGRYWSFGKWDAELDRPAPEAQAAFIKQLAEWQDNPGSAYKREGPLLVSLWADWRNSSAAPSLRNGEIDTCTDLLFGTESEPGMHFATELSDFTLAQFSAWQSHLCGLKNSSGNPRYGRFSVGMFCSLVLRCFEWGVQCERVKFEQYAMLKLLKPPRRGQVKEPKQRLPAVESSVFEVVGLLPQGAAAAVQVLWWTGARPSEILPARRDDVRREGVLVTRRGIRLDLTGLGVWALSLDQHKTSRHGGERVIFFGPQAQAVLAGIKSGVWLLPTGKGTHYDRHSLRRAVTRSCARAGLPAWEVYALRHACGVRVQQAHGREAAAAVLGHRGGMTERYAGADLTTAAKIMAEMG